MDQWNTIATPKNMDPSSSEPRQTLENEKKDPIAAKKVQKADREKLRRDRLNDQFLELGNTLDPDRPRNDKATILTDTIQMLKDLTAEVGRLKGEYATLSEESRELMQEKNELREEKASLKSDVENLNLQYQQRLRVMFPWAAVDPSAVVRPTYSYPVSVAVPSGPIPMHHSLQPFPFFASQSPGPCSTFISYPTPSNPTNENPSIQYTSHSIVSSKHDSKSNSADRPRSSTTERCDDSNDIATELELKMPGSSSQQDASCGERKGKHLQRKETNITLGPASTSSRFSSSDGIQDGSSNSIGDILKSNK